MPLKLILGDGGGGGGIEVEVVVVTEEMDVTRRMRLLTVSVDGQRRKDGSVRRLEVG